MQELRNGHTVCTQVMEHTTAHLALNYLKPHQALTGQGCMRITRQA